MRQGTTINVPYYCCLGPVVFQPVGAGFGVDGGGAGSLEGNIWEISISCPALRLLVLLSPEQRRTEKPLNGSQQAAWEVCCSGQQAHAGGREAGAAPLWKISSLWPTDLLFGAVVVFNSGESMSFARDREKPLKRQALSASPVEHPRWVPGDEGEQKIQIRKEDEWGVAMLWKISGSSPLLL